MRISDFLTHDHRACDTGFAALEQAVHRGDWPGAEAAAHEFAAAMERHFRMEEDALFPAVEAATGLQAGAGPTAVMRLEHADIRDLLHDLVQAAAAHDAEAVLGNTETLLMLMQQHNAKEENILYPLADRALNGDTATVLDHMKAVA